MKSTSDNSISIAEANQNFSKAIELAKQNGQVYIMENNEPKYCLIDLEKNPQIEMSEDEKLEFVARRILKKHKQAFLELAK